VSKSEDFVAYRAAVDALREAAKSVADLQHEPCTRISCVLDESNDAFIELRAALALLESGEGEG
jgi:hypothetical protein